MDKEPRFHGIASPQSHKAMSQIKGKDTKIEIILRKALWHRGIRYRKNYKNNSRKYNFKNRSFRYG